MLFTSAFYEAHEAVRLGRFSGVKNQVVGESKHLFSPWLKRQVLFYIRSRPRNVPGVTGRKGDEIILNIIMGS